MNSISWSEFIELSLRLKQKVPYTYLYAAQNFEGLMCTFIEFLQSDSGSIFDAHPIRLNSPEAVKALQLMVDLVHKYKLVPEAVTSFTENQCYQYALDNDVPFMRGWPGLKRQYFGVLPNSEKMEHIRVAPLPYLREKKNSAVFGGWNLMIPKDSEHKREAVTFMQFMLEKENQAILFEKSGFLPVSREFYADSLLVGQFPELMEYHQLLEYGFHRPFLVDYTRISDILSYYVNRAVRGEISAEQALIQASDQINAHKVLMNNE